MFFVRHGESEYNRSQQEMNVVKLLYDIDHGLSTNGSDECYKVPPPTTVLD